MGKQRKKTPKKRKRVPLAEKADRHILYQESVQCVEAEIDFVDEEFKAITGRRAKILREDFCGTANTSCEWVRRRRKNRAIGVDLDTDVLNWGKQNNIAKLNRQAAKRISLLNKDVLKVRTEPVDVVLAMNFSYWSFKERKTLRRYFRRINNSLVSDGLFILDAFGGYDAYRVIKERRKLGKFSYSWNQAYYNPISGDITCHIDFKFPDGSKLKQAFTYDWRLWSLPEIRELLAEAGFSNSTVYWEGTEEETGKGDGVYEPAEEGEADAGWIAYIIAEK